LLGTIGSVSERLDDLFLPYSADELRLHFVHSDIDGEDPERHLKRWRSRIAAAPAKDPSFLHRDETLWTAGALLGVQRQTNSVDLWRAVLSQLFGPIPPTGERLEWSDLLSSDLELFFEVGLPSPPRYRAWLAEHLHERQALITQRLVARGRGELLQGRTHLDALLLSPSTGFAVHFEAQVLSDIDPKTTHDSLRNQLARNIDCLAAPAGEHPVLAARKPERSFMVMLTPELFRRNWHSRLYGHLVREYMNDPAAIQRDLPHLDGLICAAISRRIGWLTFEDIRSVEPTACRWLPAGREEFVPNDVSDWGEKNISGAYDEPFAVAGEEVDLDGLPPFGERDDLDRQ
jgi:hypothetical protein